MNKFDNIVHRGLIESTVMLSHLKLDPSVFTSKIDDIPVLRDSVKVQILKDIDEIRGVLPVVNFYVVGEILSSNYTMNTDIDVAVQVDAQLIDNIATAEVMHLLHTLNGRLAADTRHPLYYYIITYEYDMDKSEAVYDVVNEKWPKVPKEYSAAVELCATKFQDTLRSIDISSGAIKQDLIDIDAIKQMKEKDLKLLRVLLKQRLIHTKEALTMQAEIYKGLKRHLSLSLDQMGTPADILDFSNKYKLPENVLYKVLEHFYYLKFIKKIEKLLNDRDVLELSDMPEVRRIMRAAWNPS